MNETPLEDTQESFLGFMEYFGLKQPDETEFHPLIISNICSNCKKLTKLYNENPSYGEHKV
jgi:hypothetical protein